MLRGQVDTATRQIITGWAADDESPDEIMEVAVFVDGRKLAQFACNAPRPDLLRAGFFGQNPHGFAYEYPTPLSNASDRRVSVRHAKSGKLLNRGDLVIQSDNNVVVRSSLATPSHAELEQLPVPRDPRSIFEMFVLFDEKAGLYELLSRIRFSSEKPRHVYYSVFGRYPETDPLLRQLDEDDHRGRYSPRDHTNELLLSQKFQSEAVPVFLNAFPEKNRLVFVHIPKCAGTDLSVNLMRRFPAIHQTLMEESWTSKDRMFQQLSNLVLYMKFSDSIFLCGHSSLGYYVSHALIRPIDRVFTIVRDPIEIAISHINYILTRITRDISIGNIGPDTREWMDILGLNTLPADMPPALIENLRSSILYSSKLLKPNSMCSWLGGTDAASASEQLIAYNVELTTVNQYGRWLEQRWAIKTETWMNRSDSFVTMESLQHQDISHIQKIYAEDIKLYAAISRAMDRSGDCSIRGEELRGVT